MKLVVFSDNHRDMESLVWIFEHNQDAIYRISCGDSEMSEHVLSNLDVFGVRGNYPFEPDFPYELRMVFGGVKTWITHGHKQSVKVGLYSLLMGAMEAESELVLFGHTHEALAMEEAGVLLVNPGSTITPRDGIKTYAIILIDESMILIEIREVYTDRIINKIRKSRLLKR